MPTQVLMPQFGESVVEGTLTQWLKTVGERVEQYEPLLEVNTDKIDIELPSPASGVLLQILVEAGVTVRAGTLLAWIGAAGEALPNIETQPADRQPEIKAGITSPAPASYREENDRRSHIGAITTGRHPELGFISPLVARLAQEHAIDLLQVTGTGLDGRITKQDVFQHIQEHPVVQANERILPAHTQPSPPAASQLTPDDELVPLSTLRRKIAEHMVFSERTSPHVTTVMEADLNRVVTHRQKYKPSLAGKGVNLTFTAYFVIAAAAALRAFPLVNSSWSDQGILLHHQINIGLATALEDGLIVPVIHHADGLSLLEAAQAVNDVAARARAHNLTPDEVRRGTFTITNHGISGSLFATPIINQPQCAILGVGAIQKRVVVLDNEPGDAIVIRPMVYLSLTFDHRILDGAIADHFLGKVVELLQNWEI